MTAALLTQLIIILLADQPYLLIYLLTNISYGGRKVILHREHENSRNIVTGIQLYICTVTLILQAYGGPTDRIGLYTEGHSKANNNAQKHSSNSFYLGLPRHSCSRYFRISRARGA